MHTTPVDHAALLRRARRLASVLAAALLAPAASGCFCAPLHLGCPAVTTFAASAHNVCAGRPVTLSWQATGSSRLVPSPTMACEVPVDPHGSRTCVVERDTLFRLQVQRGGSAMRAEQEVEVVASDGREIAIGERTECASDCVVAIANLPEQDWDPAVQVDTVVADPSRRISIVHAGRVAVLGPGATTTDVFRGTPASGKWVLASPVAAAETCAAPARAPRARRPPDALGITVRVRCGN